LRTRSLLAVSLWLFGLGLGWRDGASRAFGGTDRIAGQRALELCFSTSPSALPVPLIGTFAEAPSRSVTRVYLVNGRARMESLPDPPFPFVAAGAAVLDDSLFVFGGARAPAGKELLPSLLISSPLKSSIIWI
jgi:hypothetical protein